MTGLPALFRCFVYAGLGLLVSLSPVWGQPVICDFPGQKPILWVELFMGLNVPNRGPVTPKEWDAFLKNTVTPRFPEGFTVYDSYGQWLNEKTRTIVREKSKTIALAVNDDENTKAHIADIMAAYRSQFHQLSVGIVTSHVCAAF